MKAIVALKNSHELPYVLEVEEEELQNEDGHRQDFPTLTFFVVGVEEEELQDEDDRWLNGNQWTYLHQTPTSLWSTSLYWP